jgi:hypothetical protein
MTHRIDDDRRDPSVAAVTRGPDPDHPLHFTGDHLDLPVVLVAALEATDTTVEVFAARLLHGAIWQDQSLRSPDRRIDIQAYLPPEGLRCVIRLERNIWYHHPLETLHVYGTPLPTIGQDEALPLACVLRHDLLDTLPIMVRAVTHLNARRPELGTCIRVEMPRRSIALWHSPSSLR